MLKIGGLEYIINELVKKKGIYNDVLQRPRVEVVFDIIVMTILFVAFDVEKKTC